MDIFSAWQSVVTFGLTVVPWFLPNISTQSKIIIVLSVLLISCFLYAVRLNQKLSKLSKKYDEIQSNHKALAKRFDEKQIEARRYLSGFASVEYMLDVAVQSTKQDRLVSLQNSFLLVKKNFFKN